MSDSTPLSELSAITSLPVHDIGAAQNSLTSGAYSATTSPQVLAGLTREFATFTPSLYSVLGNLEVAARHDFTILLVGETGTGKTFLAKLIHELSPRATGPFVTVACGSLPNDLMDSELFGHVKGAFTGADRQKAGKFDAAARGTILLDEVDVLGLPQQTKLLRVLETGEYEAVGSNETQFANVRTIVASNQSLEALVGINQFRADLLYRLKQVKFEIPPLRRRPRDIPLLAERMIEECCRQEGLSIRGISPSFWEALATYSWPGNLRELRNETRRAVLFCRGRELSPEHLSPSVMEEVARRGQGDAPSSVLAGQVALTEQDIIEQMLRTQNFNRAATARALGISRVTLYNKIRKYGIRLIGGQSGN
jgi:DNA-binding NtrC family response regulator